jgi:carboxypeptidase Q
VKPLTSNWLFLPIARLSAFACYNLRQILEVSMKRGRLLAGLLLFALFVFPLVGQLQQERVDLSAMTTIREEGLQRSKVMETASYLTDVFGPRLTNSPNIKAAAQWTLKKMTEWGLTNVKLETWGPFGRGWSNERSYVGMLKPYSFPLIAYARAWTPGTNGLIKGEAVLVVINTPEDMEDCRGKLRGKFILTSTASNLPALFRAPGTRFTDQELEQMANAAQRGRGGQRGGQNGGANAPTPTKLPGQLCGGTLPAPQAARGQGQQQAQTFANQRNRFYLDEGALALITNGQTAGSVAGGTVFVQSGGNRGVNDPPVPAQISLAAEHYGILMRNVEKSVPVELEMNIENKFYDDDLNSFNIIGEIRGTDRADEAVMVGAHFDSWHTGTGATDNAAGSAVMLEALRILKATGLPLRRTVRIALWTGEEQGLFGSQAYVRDHFAIRQTMELKPEHGKMSVYFNVDNGTGQIRGVYMEGNEAARPVFEAWMQPFKDFGMTTLTTRGTGGTDHTNFDAVGLPGFQFIQDRIEYDTRTHHSNMDLYERLQSKDMMQNAVIVASFVYNAANRDDLFPRKPLPQPQGQRGGRGQ